MTDYFSKKGVRVMSLMDLFNFVTDPSFGDDNETVDRELEKASTRIILYTGWLMIDFALDSTKAQCRT